MAIDRMNLELKSVKVTNSDTYLVRKVEVLEALNIYVYFQYK